MEEMVEEVEPADEGDVSSVRSTLENFIPEVEVNKKDDNEPPEDCDANTVRAVLEDCVKVAVDIGTISDAEKCLLMIDDDVTTLLRDGMNDSGTLKNNEIEETGNDDDTRASDVNITSEKDKDDEALLVDCCNDSNDLKWPLPKEDIDSSDSANEGNDEVLLINLREEDENDCDTTSDDLDFNTDDNDTDSCGPECKDVEGARSIDTRVEDNNAEGNADTPNEVESAVALTGRNDARDDDNPAVDTKTDVELMCTWLDVLSIAVKPTEDP